MSVSPGPPVLALDQTGARPLGASSPRAAVVLSPGSRALQVRADAPVAGEVRVGDEAPGLIGTIGLPGGGQVQPD
jgi:hypothetical protein